MFFQPKAYPTDKKYIYIYVFNISTIFSLIFNIKSPNLDTNKADVSCKWLGLKMFQILACMRSKYDGRHWPFSYTQKYSFHGSGDLFCTFSMKGTYIQLT